MHDKRNVFVLVDEMNHVHRNINYFQHRDDKKRLFVDDYLSKEDVLHLIKYIELEYDFE